MVRMPEAGLHLEAESLRRNGLVPFPENGFFFFHVQCFLFIAVPTTGHSRRSIVFGGTQARDGVALVPSLKSTAGPFAAPQATNLGFSGATLGPLASPCREGA